MAAERSLPGSAAKMLAGPPLPPDTEHLWQWYLDVSVGRTYAMSGQPLPLSSLEIWAWCQLTGIRFAPWQLRAIRLLDILQVSTMNHPPANPFEEEDVA